MNDPGRPSLANSRTNWQRSNAPFGTKLKQLLRNNWTKLRTRSSCCGNLGEPGC